MMKIFHGKGRLASGLLAFALALSMLVLATTPADALDLGTENSSGIVQWSDPNLPKPDEAGSPEALILDEAAVGSLSTASRSSVHSYRLYQTTNPALAARVISNSGSCGSWTKCGVSGEPRMKKISPVLTDTRYVYLKCGKKVAEFGPPLCCCAGGWRYVNSCQKPPTVFINLPCH